MTGSNTDSPQSSSYTVKRLSVKGSRPSKSHYPAGVYAVLKPAPADTCRLPLVG